MNNEEVEYSLTIEAKDFIIPNGINDDVLFLTIKQDVLDVLNDPDTAITYFGFASDNTADNQDDLLLDGVYFRIIAYNKDLGLTLEIAKEEVLAAYSNLVKTRAPYWTTIIVEKGFIKKETTIELMYQ